MSSSASGIEKSKIRISFLTSGTYLHRTSTCLQGVPDPGSHNATIVGRLSMSHILRRTREQKPSPSFAVYPPRRSLCFANRPEDEHRWQCLSGWSTESTVCAGKHLGGQSGDARACPAPILMARLHRNLIVECSQVSRSIP